MKVNFKGTHLKRLLKSLQVVWVAQITSRTLTVEGGFTNKPIQPQEKKSKIKQTPSKDQT
jgi:hypothetical protein